MNSMKKPDPTRIANRTGRIVSAAVLASLFAAIANIPHDVWRDSFPSLTEPLSVYITLLMDGAVEFILMFFAVLAAYGLFWALTSRLERAAVWRLFSVGGVALAGVWTLSNVDGGLADYAVGLLSTLAAVAAVVLAIALVEYAAETEFDRSVSSVTLVGSGFLALGLVAIAVVGASTAGVVVADHAGYAVTDEQRYQEQLEEERDAALTENDTDGEPTPDYRNVPNDYVSLADDADGHHLLEHDNPDPPAENETYTSVDPVETHVGSEWFTVRSIEVETDNGTETVAGHYHLEFDPGMNTFRDATYDSGVLDVEWSEESGTVSTPEPDATTASGYVKMEQTESMWVYYDVVTEDGEVHRYMVYLERDDI